MPHHQRRNLRPQQEMNHEIRLPQEWTYWPKWLGFGTSWVLH